MIKRPQIILVDDDEQMRRSTHQALELAGLSIRSLASAEEALYHASTGLNGIVVSDIRMPGMDGMTLLQRLRDIDPDLPVILVTGHADVQLAVEAMRRGAYDFVEKPFGMQSFIAILRRALDHRSLVIDNRRLRAAAGQRDDLEARMPGRSAAMIDLRYRLRAIAPSDTDTLIIGATGTGKEVIAHAMHDLSPRAGKPFVAINCAALPQNMIESELFGHEAGAFPGALRTRYGRFEHARGGTVLLDEIGSMPLDLQAKLLRVLQERIITRLGSNEAVPLDVRFIATSKADIEGLVAKGKFREDLYWRLNVAVIRVPPLSLRREDIPLLFLQLAREAAARLGTQDRIPPPELLAELSGQSWPGNVRELRNTADRYVLGLDWLQGSENPAAMRLADRVAGFERSVIAGTIAAHNGHLRKVYESLGMSRKTLYEKMVKHGLDRRLITETESTED